MSGVNKQNAVAVFFHREQKKLVAYVNKLIDNTADRDAEDIVQDVILNIYSKNQYDVSVDNLSAYVYRSLKNKIIDTFRKNQKNTSLDQAITPDINLSLKDILSDSVLDTVSEIEKKETYNRLYKVIETLNEKDRAIIIATEFDGKSFRYLSETWNVPIGTLLTRKSRAIRKIKEKFLKYE